MPKRRKRFPVAVSAEIEEVELLAPTFGGDALGHLADGRVVFVPHTLPGERAMVRVEELHRDYARAELVDLLHAAPERVDPPCPSFKEGCGGCSWQHASYAAQLRFKEQIVGEQLRRIGHFSQVEELVRPSIGMVEPWHYRNQARFSIGRRFGELCFTFRSSRRLLRVDHCWIVHPRINEILETLQGRLGEIPLPDHQVAIRVGANTGDLLVVPEVLGLLDVPAGQRFLEEEILNRRFRLQASSFFQVNTRREARPLPDAVPTERVPLPVGGLSMADILALLVIDRLQLTGDELVIDAYSGVGTFALLVAPLADTVIGIEEATAAVHDARHNGRDVPNVEFVEGRCEEVLPRLALDRRPDAVILDPARVGAHRAVLDALLSDRLRPPRIVYVSCDPATLARDLRILVDGGYRVLEVQPLDMFPHTHHLECVATLEI